MTKAKKRWSRKSERILQLAREIVRVEAEIALLRLEFIRVANEKDPQLLLPFVRKR